MGRILIAMNIAGWNAWRTSGMLVSASTYGAENRFASPLPSAFERTLMEHHDHRHWASFEWNRTELAQIVVYP